MKKSTKSNMYEISLEVSWSLFGEYLSGQRESLICVISTTPLSEKASEALQRSFAQLGYGNAACTFASLSSNATTGEEAASARLKSDTGPKIHAHDATDSDSDGANEDISSTSATLDATDKHKEKLPFQSLPRLTEKELLPLIEGIDPLLLVITDTEAAECCSKCYRQTIPLDKRSRLFGREVRAFSSFESMLEDSASKQKAWGLLKSFPRLES